MFIRRIRCEKQIIPAGHAIQGLHLQVATAN